ARHRRRLRTVRDRPGAGPADLEQQPRQHAAGRPRASHRLGAGGRAGARRARRVRPRPRAPLGAGWHAARDREPVDDRARVDPGRRPASPTGAAPDMTSVPQRYGITVPVPGLPLAEHRELYEEIAALGYTDLWSAETNVFDAFTPLALAAAWTPTLRLGTAI